MYDNTKSKIDDVNNWKRLCEIERVHPWGYYDYTLAIETVRLGVSYDSLENIIYEVE